MLSIVDVADEVLVYIFSFLPAIDLINVEKVSDRFQRLCCEKRVVQKLNFNQCYDLTASALKNFLRVKLRCLNIKEVNLNSCYWLLASHFKVLAKLKHLKGLHLLDCRVTLKSLCQLLTGLELESLSWTWDDNVKQSDLTHDCHCTLHNSLNKLKHLRIEVSSPFHLSQICFILQCCLQLERLEIAETSTGFTESRSFLVLSHTYPFHLPCLQQCKFFLRSSMGFNVERFIQEILKLSFSGSKCLGFWTSEGGCRVLVRVNEETRFVQHIHDSEFLSLNGTRGGRLNVIRTNIYTAQAKIAKQVLKEGLSRCHSLSLDLQRVDSEMLSLIANKCPNLECLSLKDCQVHLNTAMISGLLAVSEMCTKLSTLCLLGTHIHTDFNPCIFIANIKGLRVLTLSACLLATPAQVAADDDDGILADQTASTNNDNAQRIGVNPNPTELEIQQSRLYPVTQNCLLLETLAIKSTNATIPCEKVVNKVTDRDLFCIANLTNLRSLELVGLTGIRYGSFLTKVCQSCHQLRNLSLTDIGPKGHFVYSNALLEALRHCKEIRDLKLEQKYDLTVIRMEEPLMQCQKLQRLCFISEGGSAGHVPPAAVVRIVEKLPKLIALYLVLPASVMYCKELSDILRKAFKPRRHAFHCKVANTRGSLIGEGQPIPNCHLQEFV